MTPTGPEPWRVVLIVEDDSDGRALRRLAQASGFGQYVDWLPAHGIGNIKRKLDALVRLAEDRFDPGQGCVAVVVDRDGKDCRRDEPHRTIHQACEALRIPYIEAVEKLEAWFLADAGIVSWLGWKARRATDRIHDPKAALSEAFHRKTKRSYERRLGRTQVTAKATGVQEARSQSWAEAIRHLRRCPAKPRRSGASGADAASRRRRAR